MTVSLPDPIELKSTSTSIDTVLLIPNKIFIKNDKLIIFEPLTKDMFKVFDFPSLTFLHSFGDRGQGPNDFISNAVTIIDNDNDLVEIYDHNKIKFVTVSDTSAYITSEAPVSLLHLKSPVNRPVKINDSIYYFDNIFEENQNSEFTRLNIKSGERTYFSSYPNWVKSSKIESDMDKYMTYLKSSFYSFSHKKIVAFYYRFPVMKILDFNGNLIKEIHIKTAKSSFDAPNNDNTIYFIESSFLTDDYIYVLWAEKSKNEIMTDPGKFRPQILVFDWEGNIVGRYAVDKPVTSFTISEKTGKIYANPFPEKDVINYIYEYDLPKIENSNSTITRIENSFYSMNFFEEYILAMGSVQNGIDKVIEKNGYKSNVNYYVPGRDGQYFKSGEEKHEFGTLRIVVRFPIEDTNKNKLEDFLTIKEEYQKDVQRRDFTVDNLVVYQTVYYIESRDPNNKLEITYFCDSAFKLDNTVVEISIGSTKDIFSQYDSEIKKMISSFKLKNQI
jgi:hypothetical protein